MRRPFVEVCFIIVQYLEHTPSMFLPRVLNESIYLDRKDCWTKCLARWRLMLITWYTLHVSSTTTNKTFPLCWFEWQSYSHNYEWLALISEQPLSTEILQATLDIWESCRLIYPIVAQDTVTLKIEMFISTFWLSLLLTVPRTQPDKLSLACLASSTSDWQPDHVMLQTASDRIWSIRDRRSRRPALKKRRVWDMVWH